MMHKLLLAALVVATGCTDASHSITIDAELRVDAGRVHFMTPAGSIADIDPETVVGKPYFAAVFPAGFAPGIDPPIHYGWGRMAADLRVEWGTPADLENGQYDLLLVVYVVTSISDSVYGTEGAAAAVAGDVATFTLEEKDPPVTAGLLRVKLSDADAKMVTWNKWSRDLSAGVELFTDTMLLVP